MFVTHDQVARLADVAGPYGTFVRTLAYTGLRWGEAAALRIRDVDLGRRRLDVRRAFADNRRRAAGGHAEDHQMRTVPLPPWLCAQLRPYVEWRSPDQLVFTSPGGYPLR